MNSDQQPNRSKHTAPSISVIVPIYNAEAYVAECIESILYQSFSDFELILINDGSADNSLEICNKYAGKDSRIQVVSVENGGVTSARQHGLKLATGFYICFVDADDSIPPNSLQDLFAAHDDADIVIGTYREISADKKVTHPITDIPSEFTGTDYIRFQLENRLFHSPWAKLIKSSCFDETTLAIPRTIFRGEDFLMNIRLGKNATRIKKIDAVTYHYMIRETSCMMTHQPSLAYEKLFDSYLTASFSDKRLYNSFKSSILHQRIEAISGLILANYRLDVNDEFVQTVYQASRVRSLDVSQILFRLFLFYPALYRFLYKTARKLKAT